MKIHNKLVRDNIPNLIEFDNKKAVYRKLNNNEYIHNLNKKLLEELDEYLTSNNIEEIVDIYDVLDAILEAKNISKEEFDSIRDKKANKNGLFNDKIFLEKVFDEEEVKFLNNFKMIVKKCKYSNTYKFAWAKSLVEIASESMDEEIPLLYIAEKYSKYYWNQSIHNDFKQGQRPPRIINIVKELMVRYSRVNDMDIFENIEKDLKTNFKTYYNKCLKQIVVILKKDVSYRFISMNREDIEGIYEYNKGDDQIRIKLENLRVLKENSQELIDLIDYRWGLVLEGYMGKRNSTTITSDNLNQELLEKFRTYLY